MQLSQQNTRKWSYLALSFLFPFVGILCIMIAGEYAPFGKYALLYSDMYHQYFPFFKAFRQALLSGESLLYSWDVGMGMDYLGLISYYLASPLNLLTVLVPEEHLLSFFSLLMPVRLSLASLFFAVFLKNMFGKNDLSLPLFGCMYGMCAWAVGYQWNIMWLDGFLLLPLMALGTVRLLRDKKCILYTVILFLSVFSNYYIGFFVCIFVLLLFICYQICRCKSFKRLCLDFVRIGWYTVLAIGMTTVLELPALAALGNTHSSVNTFPEGFSVNMISGEAVDAAKAAWKAFTAAKEAGEGGLVKLWVDAIIASVPPLLQGMQRVAGNMGGGLTPTMKEGLPNLYCGTGTIVFAFLFLTSQNVRRRDKICSVALLVFFMLSFIIRQLDFIWHGFHFPNMIPYRFSFLFSFVLLYMAYRAYLLRHRFKLWQLMIAGILTFDIIAFSDNTAKLDETGAALSTLFNALLSQEESAINSALNGMKSVTGVLVFFAWNILFLIIYLAVMMYSQVDRPLPKDAHKDEIRRIARDRTRRRGYATTVLCLVFGLELILNTVNFGVKFPRTSISNYPSGTNYSASVIRYMHEREDDTLFFRAETTHTQTLNDGALNGYNGVSTFTSSANVRVTEFMKTLGYAAKNTYNRYCFEESSPVSNLFLNLKYMIEREGRPETNNYFDEAYRYDKVILLQNNAYLPLGFMTQKELAELPFSTLEGAFAFQNNLFSAATGLEENVWYLTPDSAVKAEGFNAQVYGGVKNGKCSYKASASGTVVYTITAREEGLMCLDLNMPSRNSFSVKHNGVELYKETMAALPQTLSVCQVQPGDTVEVHVKVAAKENSTVTIRSAILREGVFRTGYDLLNASTLELTEFSNTYVEGTLSCTQDGLLYTSIPHDGNWYVRVDGEEVEHTLVGDAMIAVELSEGDHTVSFTYRNKAFELGSIISLTCFGLFLVSMVATPWLRARLYKGKYEQ